jgi:hypothetical protein
MVCNTLCQHFIKARATNQGPEPFLSLKNRKKA